MRIRVRDLVFVVLYIFSWMPPTESCNTAAMFHLREESPVSPLLKVHFFNLTNPEAVFEGTEKPKLSEVGPYTYRERWFKDNMTWHDHNGTFSYNLRKVITFSPSDSCEFCQEGDVVTTLNVPAISAYLEVHGKGLSPYQNAIVEGGIKLLHNVWMRKNVSDLLWGYEEKLFKAAQFFPDPPSFKKFGIFGNRNTSDESLLGEYNMYTGLKAQYGYDNTGLIHSYNGKTEWGFWNDSQCDTVLGWDGISFKPSCRKNDTLWFFNDQLCRAIPLVFEKDIQQEGLSGLRFVPREDVFMSSKKYPENQCYAGEGREEGEGVFDVSVCTFGAPIVLSWPHFLGAEHKYRDAVEGLSPEKSKHGFWFDIEPLTGTTLSGKARFQINMKVPNLEEFSDLSKVNTTVLPILWVEEGIELGPKNLAILENILFVGNVMGKHGSG